MPKDEGAAPVTEEIHVPLLNEGTDVWRPTQGCRLSVSQLTYKVLATPDYDPQAEEWEFIPGTVVACQYRKLSGSLCLVAVRTEPTPDSDASTALSEEVALSSGISLRACGGLRLVAASEATRFVDACANRSVKVWGINAFRVEAGSVVLTAEAFRSFLTPEFNPAQLSLPNRIAIAREFCSKHAAPGLWFDLLLSDPRAPRGEDQCPGGHLAPLPTPDPRLRIVETPEFSSLRETLEARRGVDGNAYLAELTPAGEVVDPRRLLRDLAVLAFGDELPWYIRIEPVERVWQSMRRDAALDLATKAVAHELAYHGREMEDAEARAIVEQFVRLFGPEVLFHTNQDIGKRGFPSGGFPVTNATMEATLGATDGRRVGLLIITGED